MIWCELSYFKTLLKIQKRSQRLQKQNVVHDGCTKQGSLVGVFGAESRQFQATGGGEEVSLVVETKCVVLLAGVILEGEEEGNKDQDHDASIHEEFEHGMLRLGAVGLLRHLSASSRFIIQLK